MLCKTRQPACGLCQDIAARWGDGCEGNLIRGVRSIHGEEILEDGHPCHDVLAIVAAGGELVWVTLAGGLDCSYDATVVSSGSDVEDVVRVRQVWQDVFHLDDVCGEKSATEVDQRPRIRLPGARVT